MLPTKKQIARSREIAKNFSVQPGKSKNKIHYGVFLLCFGAGLRVSEAISFSEQKKVNGLYQVKSKNHRQRWTAVSNKIINEIKANNWQPKQTNRFNFAHYCQRIKKEAGIPNEVELTPHTGRKAWTTYQAENGTPLPLLANMLGHKNMRTTAEYYWKNIYKENEMENILFGQQLTEKMNIFSKVKDKNFWREYNSGRKEYFHQYYLKKISLAPQEESKKMNLNERKDFAEPLRKRKDKGKILQHNFTIKTEREKLNAYQAHEPPKSRLEISK